MYLIINLASFSLKEFFSFLSDCRSVLSIYHIGFLKIIAMLKLYLLVWSHLTQIVFLSFRNLVLFSLHLLIHLLSFSLKQIFLGILQRENFMVLDFFLTSCYCCPVFLLVDVAAPPLKVLFNPLISIFICFEQSNYNMAKLVNFKTQYYFMIFENQYLH